MTYHMALLESKLEDEKQWREEDLPVEQIQRLTKLTVEKIQNLANKMND